jgi:signal peptidase I
MTHIEILKAVCIAGILAFCVNLILHNFIFPVFYPFY